MKLGDESTVVASHHGLVNVSGSKCVHARSCTSIPLHAARRAMAAVAFASYLTNILADRPNRS